MRARVPHLPGERLHRIKGGFLAFGPSEDYEWGARYVRFLDEKGQEVLYYDRQEWADEPEQVMGVICRGVIEGVKAMKLRQCRLP